MNNLAQKFENELLENSIISKKECKYNPTYFNQMIAEIGGVNTAKRLIEKGMQTVRPSEGYTTLFMCGRLDLTMESIVCKKEYAPLFTASEIEYCKKLIKP